MVWTWELVTRLNEVLSKASEEVHAVRQVPWWATATRNEIEINQPSFNIGKDLAENHYFVSANKRTGVAVASSLVLENV